METSASTHVSPAPTTHTELRAIDLNEPEFASLVKHVCDGMVLAGYRLCSSFVRDDEDRLVLIFQR